MKVFRFNDFIKKYFNNIKESSIPLYKNNNIFKPEKTVKKTEILFTIKKLLEQQEEGIIKEINVVAEIPTQGKNAPEYLEDVYNEMERYYNEKYKDAYDPETGIYMGNRYKNPDEPKYYVYIDSEFIIKDVDLEEKILIGTPYSLRHKGIVVKINPDNVDEIHIKI